MMSELKITPFDTPNPNARKFTLNRSVDATMLNFGSAEEAAGNPLAYALFQIDGVTNVFLTGDFITVNKLPDINWQTLQSFILSVIEAQFTG